MVDRLVDLVILGMHFFFALLVATALIVEIC